MRIVIDFDGTIVEEQFPNIGPIKPFVIDVIQQWFKDGNSIIINTCRAGKYEGEAETFLHEYNIPFNYINCNLPSDIEAFGQDCRKISGDIYIDDKQLGGLPDWLTIDKLVRTHPKYTNKVK